MFQIFPTGSSRDITTEFHALSIPHSRECPKIHADRFCHRDGEEEEEENCGKVVVNFATSENGQETEPTLAWFECTRRYTELDTTEKRC